MDYNDLLLHLEAEQRGSTDGGSCGDFMGLYKNAALKYSHRSIICREASPIVYSEI